MNIDMILIYWLHVPFLVPIPDPGSVVSSFINWCTMCTIGNGKTLVNMKSQEEK